MSQIQNIYKVVGNEPLGQRFWKLSLQAPSLAKSIKPGQFIHIRVAQGLEPFFRRPFSVYRAKKTIDILYEPIGRGTKVLATKKKGEELDVLGPLGNQFSMPPKGIKQVVMIGGGIGIAPMLVLSDALKGKGFDLIVLYGGRTKGHTFNMSEFKKNGCKVYVATDDGSVGVKGRVSKLFDKITAKPNETFIYTCGPHVMMHAVQDFAKQKGIKGEAACEEVMACALGACLGCSIKTTSGYKTVCYDGPIFDLAEVIFY